MTKEFKKITNNYETRYVIESMTAGATGAGAIATAPGKLGGLQKRLQELKDKVSQKPRQGPLRPQTGAGAHKNKKKDQQRGIEKHKGQSVYQEEFNGEYDDEAGMAESNLHTLARAVKGLMDTIDSNDNLPEWCQEKIAKAELMLVSVWDYMLSQKEQGIDPEIDIAEGYREYHELRDKVEQILIKVYNKYGTRDQIIDVAKPMAQKVAQQMGLEKYFDEIWRNVLANHDVDTNFGDDDDDFDYTDYSMRKGERGLAEGEQRMSRAAKGHEKYGKAGMQALAKAGRDGAGEEKLDKIRDKHDKYNEDIAAEGLRDPKDNPCWKGYKPVGTKKKGGRTVPNCVPVKEDDYTEKLRSQLEEKFVSKQQAKLMYAVAGDKDVAKKTGVSSATAREFIKKSHGQKVTDLPKTVKKK